MTEKLNICEVDQEVQKKLKKFRLRKETNNAAYILKIDPEKLMVVEDEYHEDVDVDELREELPSHVPRYVVYSFEKNHPDGRKSYPLAFIFISPQGTKPELQMMYAASRNNVVNVIGVVKHYELRDLDEFTEEWLMARPF